MPWSQREVADHIIREVFAAVYGDAELEKCAGQPGLTTASTYPLDVDLAIWAGQAT